MRKNRSLVALGGLLTLLAGGAAVLSFGCDSTLDLGLSIGIDNDDSTDDADVGGAGDTTNDTSGSGGEIPVDEGAAEDDSTTEAETEGPDDSSAAGTVGDATCLAVTSAESESSVQCATGSCGSVQWQNDCGENVVVVLLDASRERILQLLGITSGGVGTAFVDPEDWSDDLAYGIVVGTDSVECSFDADCSVSDLIERELLDLDELVAIAVN